MKSLKLALVGGLLHLYTVTDAAKLYKACQSAWLNASDPYVGMVYVMGCVFPVKYSTII